MTVRMFTIFAAAMGIIMGTMTPARAALDAPWGAWKTTGQAGHPLVGRIWSVKKRAYVSQSELVSGLADKDFILLGETHDNADHHRLQAWVIGKVVKAARQPAVVMEMIATDQSTALNEYLAGGDANAKGLGPALDWEKRGWYSWDIYRPIAEAAFAAGLSIRAGDATKEQIKSVGRKGFSVLVPADRKRLAIDTPLSKPLDRSLRDELFHSHCEMMPREALDPMMGIQRFRDAVMADNVLAADRGKGVFLIAGDGHVRLDRGVPWYLARRAPDKSLGALMIVEVRQDETDPEKAARLDPNGQPVADYIWFTPRAEREDPCKRFEQMMKRKKHKTKS